MLNGSHPIEILPRVLTQRQDFSCLDRPDLTHLRQQRRLFQNDLVGLLDALEYCKQDDIALLTSLLHHRANLKGALKGSPRSRENHQDVINPRSPNHMKNLLWDEPPSFGPCQLAEFLSQSLFSTNSADLCF